MNFRICNDMYWSGQLFFTFGWSIHLPVIIYINSLHIFLWKSDVGIKIVTVTPYSSNCTTWFHLFGTHFKILAPLMNLEELIIIHAPRHQPHLCPHMGPRHPASLADRCQLARCGHCYSFPSNFLKWWYRFVIFSQFICIFCSSTSSGSSASHFPKPGSSSSW
jgi:hypothetical protein